MLEINNLTLSRRNKWILSDVSLNIKENNLIGIVAPNGTGKTTFLKTISGLLAQESGEIKIKNILYKKDRKKYLSNIFFIENNDFLYSEISAISHLKYVKNTWGSSVNINDVIKNLYMEDYKNLPIKKMSLGMKQKVLIAMCQVSDASIIMLDEPMNGLDPTNLQLVSELFLQLKRRNRIIIISSHDLNNITEICDEVLFFNNKKFEIVEDTSQEDLKKLYNDIYHKERAK